MQQELRSPHDPRIKRIDNRMVTWGLIIAFWVRMMNSSKALAIAFAASIICLPVSGNAEGPVHSHSGEWRLHFHRTGATAVPSSEAQMSSRGAPAFQRRAARRLVTNDSDGLSRNPEDCNKGCVGNSQ